jgi:ribonucleoside-diphosphate reductase alpha chain
MASALKLSTSGATAWAFLGLGSTITMLRMKYGEQNSLEFTERVAQRYGSRLASKAGLHLAREKGPAPIMDDQFDVTAAMLFKQPDMVKDGIKVGDKLKGKVLMAKYSRYMQNIASVAPELVESLIEEGCRFSHHSSIAPTGTISLSLANNVSNGIEPSFAHHYSRNVIREGKKSKEKVDVFSYELLAYRTLVNENAMPYGTSEEEALPDYFMSSENITAQRPRRYSGSSAEMGRFVYLQNNQRAHGL